MRNIDLFSLISNELRNKDQLITARQFDRNPIQWLIHRYGKDWQNKWYMTGDGEIKWLN